ncbi:OstA-like protein [Blattabacterium cuenoti]|uniref:Organic solvent tolerance-like N-terminal domain-containing protein n=1 Tax=Blattabacterium cuenoti STAT TaxID=1457030 RepID=A0A224AJC4_9FLAO|nr:OstA-like protein [Blattabacterium cuenoti]BBA16964.1 hypothetical protein STAT_017 [Blattabacterium cuenoti STAT]
MKYGFFIFIILLLFSLNKTFSISNKKIKSIQIIHADLIQNNVENQIFVLIGNVHLKYDNYHLFCDKIIYNKKDNKYRGYGNVRLSSGKNKIISQNIVGNFINFQLSGKVVLYIHQGKIKLTSDIVNFFFKKKLFQAINHVVLFFNKIKLTTNILEYDLVLNQIFYKKNSVIYYRDYTISSKEGFFYINKKKIELKDEIKLINQNYTVYTNTVKYLFEKDQIYFDNPTIIVQNTNINHFIYTKKALFSIQKKIFLFKKYVSIHYNDQIIKGEYLFFDQKKNFGFMKNIFLENAKKKYFLISGYGEFDFHSDSLIFQKNPRVIKILKNNSIFIYSNILKVNLKKNDTFSLQGFSIKIFFMNENETKTIVQGICNLFHYESSNDDMKFYGNPIFWLFHNQKITGKTIYIQNDEKNNFLIKNIKIIGDTSYIEKINSEEFNQTEGDIITGFFNKENFLEKVIIQGNVNSIFFLSFNSSKEKKIINKSYCEILSIYLDKSKKIRKIFCEKKAYSELIPVDQKTPKKFFYLSNFNWKEESKPKKNQKLMIYKEMEKYKKEGLLEKQIIKNMINRKKFL